MTSRRELLAGAAALLLIRNVLAQGRIEPGVRRREGDVRIQGNDIATGNNSLAVFVVGRYGDELTAVITHTIDQWDGKEASRKIELQVGKDLQFVRINGTIVGGLVGVIIHAVGTLVS